MKLLKSWKDVLSHKALSRLWDLRKAGCRIQSLAVLLGSEQHAAGVLHPNAANCLYRRTGFIGFFFLRK